MKDRVIWWTAGTLLMISALFRICLADNSSVLIGSKNSTRCDDARLRCAYRTGCGMALQHYLTQCTSVLHGAIHRCPESCQHALIALTSTDEGKDLMRCDCRQEDHLCKQSKQRVEICRSSVLAAMNKTRLSCRIATWICNADAICATALTYYNEFCKSMFHGKKCSHRCRNSINILRRQEKADKLNTCICDGEEDYDCRAIQRNMNQLCYGKVVHNNYQDEKSDKESINTNKIPNSGSTTSLLLGLYTDSSSLVINRIILSLYIVVVHSYLINKLGLNKLQCN